MKKSTFISLLLSAFTLSLVVSCSNGGNEPAPAPVEEVSEVAEVHNPLGFCPDSLTVVEGSVNKGQFFSNLLNSLGMGASEHTH